MFSPMTITIANTDSNYDDGNNIHLFDSAYCLLAYATILVWFTAIYSITI